MPATERELNACLEVMRDAILQARIWGWDENVPAVQLADLMDAIHNIPTYIQHWDQIGKEAVKNELRLYDEKYPRSVDGVNGLVQLYEHVLNSNGERS